MATCTLEPDYIGFDITGHVTDAHGRGEPPVKPLAWVGSSRDDLRSFPDDVRREAGYQLDKVQRGERPTDFKPMHTVGSGVREIRVRGEAGQFRVFYVAKFEEAVYVLHAFQKKSQKTPKRDLELARRRYRDLQEYRSAL